MSAGSKRAPAVLAAIAGASLAAGAAVAGKDPINQSAGPIFLPPSIVAPPSASVNAAQGDVAAGQVNATEVSAEATSAIVQQLTGARDFCGRIADADYIVDCLASEVGALADRMAERGDYAEARQELEQASRSLAQLATANRDPAKPAARARRTGTQPRTSARELTPTRRAALGNLLDDASGILEEAETTLLRASQRGAERRVHFERIAEAVGSNKVLLRSL